MRFPPGIPFLSPAAAGGADTATFLALALALALVIALAKLGGYLSVRLRQPAVLGELLAGLILGPSVLYFLQWAPFAPYGELLQVEIQHFAEIGVLLLMFIAGLELHLSDLVKSGKVAAFAGVIGILLPMLLGAGTMALFGYPMYKAIFVGLILSATSVSISAQTLMELGRLRSRVGLGLLGSAVLDDVMVILGISIFFAVFESGGGNLVDILVLVGRMAGFLILAVGVGLVVLPRLASRIEKLPISRGLLAFVFVAILLYSWAAEAIGHMAPITGAFVAGLVLARSPLKHKIEEQVSAAAYGLFVPVFFVSVGLAADARLLDSSIVLILAVLTVGAAVGKVAGCGLGGYWGGLNRRQALQLGIGMMSRGEVGLIIANQGISSGIIAPQMFAVVVGIVILTTLATPVFLRLSFREEAQAEVTAT
ncbi:MAG: cation:proton antiporter [Anaerolineae bacterium]|nr:MAG: cation:proton antiporter [Anaerolineae bacterium]